MRGRDLKFSSTETLPPADGPLGQSQALAALDFGLTAGAQGYNVFVSGANGSGRLRTSLERLQALAPTRPPVSDWIYVHNFEDLDAPRAIPVAEGSAAAVKRDFDDLITGARLSLRKAFEGESYQRRRDDALADLETVRQQRAEQLRTHALAQGFLLQPGPAGFVAVPVRAGQPVTPEQIAGMPEEERRALERGGEDVRQAVEAFLVSMRELDREAGERIRSLDREICLQAIRHLVDALRARYVANPALIAHLDAVCDDIPNHVGDFVRADEGTPTTGGEATMQLDHVDRYRVNAFTQHADGGAPVVHERNPTYYNLFGRIEYRAFFGMQVTDFLHLKPGAVHRANGGYLVLEAEALLSTPFSWPALKRALQSQSVRMENLGEQYSAVPTSTLAPEPIPLDVKVVLIGSPAVYQLLLALDEEFRELFRVKVEFAPDLAWTSDTVEAVARFISRVVRDHGLRHFQAAAVGRIVEHASRLQADQGYISASAGALAEVITEASLWAARSEHELVTADDVESALSARERRSALVEDRIDKAIDEGTLAIAVTGSRLGRANGLSVFDLGDHAFGRPVSVSAQVALGRGGVASIDREIELSGPIHSKGVLILSAYLAATFAQTRPLAIAATITFEQSYAEVEGDSASSAELYALLSAISGTSLRQDVAVTGAVNQHGEVLAIGGVNEKVEGFFEVCRRRGLTGGQGVIIPAANVRHLMLSSEVVGAVRRGRFSVWAVEHVDQGIEILTGVGADEIRRRAVAKLDEYAKDARDWTVTSADTALDGKSRRRRHPQPTPGVRR